jgi:hypothetical protein
MEPRAASRLYSDYIRDPLSEDAILIIGAGYFGKRAARILSGLRLRPAPILIVDKDRDSLVGIKDPAVEKILCDGIGFLVKNFHFLHPSNTVIPAVPVHLAFEWLKKYLDNDYRVSRIEVPEEIKQFLPHTWEGKEGSLLISQADFSCRDDCPEPADYCTVTGETRGKPLYELLKQLDLPNHRIHIITSRQLAPGLGGYRADDLRKLFGRVRREGMGKWLVGTACRCHGTVTAMEVCRK